MVANAPISIAMAFLMGIFVASKSRANSGAVPSSQANSNLLGSYMSANKKF
jgi:hypothetical protein